ncbi:PAAR domain-containing protein [uncultured Roseobacter sp.]|uniref:PAAR domain-containing protein n=1 Tax=uncultured Roseobacter sp. TaxID=114847 RepID=UPI0034533FC0
MSKPLALLGHDHTCPRRGHRGGPIVSTGQSYVTVDGVPIATVSDKLICTGPPTTDSVTSGSSLVTIDGKPVARIGDSCAHGGTIVEGVSWITSG